MRLVLSMMVLAVLGSFAISQQPAGKVDAELLGHLQAWEKRMKEIDKISCEVDKIEKDNVLRREFKRTGKIQVMKPNLAKLELGREKSMPADPNDRQEWLCDGQSIYQYEYRQKEMTEFKLKANGGIQGNLMMEFMSGSITAEMMIRRFDMKLIGQDSNYLHIELTPTQASDKTDFEKLTLSLVSPKIAPQYAHVRYLPASITMTKNSNRESETWQFTRNLQINKEDMRKEIFVKPPLPAGWKANQMFSFTESAVQSRSIS